VFLSSKTVETRTFLTTNTWCNR